MKRLLTLPLAMTLMVTAQVPLLAQADCGIEAGTISILSDDFPAMHVVAERALQCSTAEVSVSRNQSAEHKNIQVPALSADPATYSVAIVPNNSLPPLLKDDLVRPLDELIRQFAPDLPEQQMIRIDGKVMAVAFMVNTQHLWYRSDILQQAGLEVPTSYEGILEAAASLREQGIMQYPLALNLKPGWDLGTEFLNLYNAYGGKFFAADSAEPAIDGEAGVKTLNMLKALSEFMSPDFTTFNTSEATRRWQAGELAFYNNWSSRTGNVLDPDGDSTESVQQNSVFATAPTVDGNDTPASFLWWVGFTIARNVSDEDAEASFRAMMHAISPQLLEEHSDQAVWLIEGYEPSAAARGAFDTVQAGARPYPMLPYMGLLQSALSDNLAQFLQGQESAEQALADVVRSYRTAATEAGFLQ